MTDDDLKQMFATVGNQLTKCKENFDATNDNFASMGKRIEEIFNRFDNLYESTRKAFESVGHDISLLRDTAQIHERRVFRIETEAPTGPLRRPTGTENNPQHS